MANCGDGPLALAFPCFPKKTDFMVTKNRRSTWGLVQPIPRVRVKGTHIEA